MTKIHHFLTAICFFFITLVSPNIAISGETVDPYETFRKDAGRTGPLRHHDKSRVLAGLGKAEIYPDDDVTAGSVHTWKITFTVGQDGLDVGDGILVSFPHLFTIPFCAKLPIPYFLWHTVPDTVPLVTNPGCTTVDCSNPQTNLVTFIDANRDHGYAVGEGKNLYVTVKKAPLKKGDMIEIIYGDISYGSPGAVASSIAQLFEFEVIVFRQMNWQQVNDELKEKPRWPILRAAKEWYFIERPPLLRVVGGEAVKLLLNAPTTLSVGEKGNLTVVVRDRYENVSDNYKGTIHFLPQADAQLPDSYIFSREDHGWYKFEGVLAFKKPGVYRLTIQDKDRSLKATSNPIIVTEKTPKLKVWWGDFHVHTMNSDGLGTPDMCYKYAQGPSALDFCAISDHGRGTVISNRAATSRHYKPGEFVTFNGFEESLEEEGGDVNIYFLEDDSRSDAILRTEGPASAPILHKKEAWARLRTLKNGTVMAIPHLHAGGGWEEFDEPFMRNVEIYSVWGNGEYEGASPHHYKTGKPRRTVQAALARGLRLGIVAGGDEHAGHAGYGDWKRNLRDNHGGLTAVFASSLNRKSIWNALWNRQCYATTGSRIYLEFTVNGAHMGQEVHIDQNRKTSRKISFRVEGTAPLDGVEIIRNNQVVYRTSGEEPNLCSISTTWVDNEKFDEVAFTPLKSGPSFIFYYLKVIQKDNEMAWSSPVWFVNL